MSGDASLPFVETVSESNMEGVAASVEPASHRSLFVPGELHLGPVGRCHKCRRLPDLPAPGGQPTK